MMRGAYILLVICLFAANRGTAKSWDDPPQYPSGSDVKNALSEATFHPLTVYPFLGAVFLSLTRWDNEVSRQISTQTPIYGDQDRARAASDDLLAFLRFSSFFSSALTSSGDSLKSVFHGKLKGALMVSTAISLNHTSTRILKDESNKLRPDGSDRRSFPSGHSSSAATHASIIASNLNYMNWMNQEAVRPLQIFSYSLVAATAWARVEGNKHFLSDVLIGCTLGNFLSRFVYNTFLPGNLEGEKQFVFQPMITRDQFSVSLRLEY